MKNLIDEINLIITEITTYFETEKDFWIKILNENDGKVLNQYRVNLIQLIENEEITKLNILLTDFDKLKQYLKGDLDENSNQLIRYLKQELENLKRIKGYLMSSQDDILKNKDFIIQEINYLNNLLRITNTAGKDFKSTLNTLIDKKSLNENDRNERISLLKKSGFNIEKYYNSEVIWNNKQRNLIDLLVTDLWLDLNAILSKIINSKNNFIYSFMNNILPTFILSPTISNNLNFYWPEFKRIYLKLEHVNRSYNLILNFIIPGVEYKSFRDHYELIINDIFEIYLSIESNAHSFFLLDNDSTSIFGNKYFEENFEYIWNEFKYFISKSWSSVFLLRTDFHGHKFEKVAFVALFENELIRENYNLIRDDLIKITTQYELGANNIFINQLEIFNLLKPNQNFIYYWKDFVKLLYKSNSGLTFINIIRVIFINYSNDSNSKIIWEKCFLFFNQNFQKIKLPSKNLDIIIDNIIKLEDFKLENLEDLFNFIISFDFSEYTDKSIEYVAKIYINYYKFDKDIAKKLTVLIYLLEKYNFNSESFFKDYDEDIPNLNSIYLIIAEFILKKFKFYPNPELILKIFESKISLTKKDILLFLDKESDLYNKSILYSNLRKKVDFKYDKLSEELSYKNFNLNNYHNNKEIELSLVNKYKEVMIWTSLEILRVENFIRLLRQNSYREILIVGNLRLGEVYTKPLEIALKDLKGIKIKYATLKSTPFHETVSLIINPFDKETLNYILKNKPQIVIIDASIMGKFPDAYKGYINFFNLLNHQINPEYNLWDSLVDDNYNGIIDFKNLYAKDPSYSSTNKLLKRISKKHNNLIYDLHLLSHPDLSWISLVRKHHNIQNNRLYNVNSSDIKEKNYSYNLVSENYFNNINYNGNGLFLINSYFPFLNYNKDFLIYFFNQFGIYSNRLSFKISNYSFDDKDEVLPNKLLIYDDDKIKLDNQILLEELTKTYLEVKQKLKKKD